MPKGKNKKYSKKQMKIARVAPPRDKITGADFAALRKSKKEKDMAKLCPAGKAAAKRKFKVYPSAYNMWASKYCKGKVGKRKLKREDEFKKMDI